MTKKEAIKILKKQIDKVDELNHLNIDSWKIQTATYLEKFFNNKKYSDKITNFYLTDFNTEIQGLPNKSTNDLKSEMKDFLFDCIETISNIDLYKEPIENWFSRLPNWIINLGLPALCLIAYTLGSQLSNNNHIKTEKPNTVVIHDSINKVNRDKKIPN